MTSSRGDYSHLFMPNQPAGDTQRIRQMFSAQDFPPIAAHPDTTKPPPPVQAKPPPTKPSQPQPPQQQVVHQYNANQTVNGPSSTSSFQGSAGPYGAMSSQVTLSGTGVLTWLSPKAGVITIPDGRTVSFQTNEFCDRGLHDLTTSLRVGFTLKFSAMHTQRNEYTAVCVGPVFGDEAKEVFADSEELNLHPTDESKPRGKEEYAVDLELAAYQALLAPFEKQGVAKLQLSGLHSQLTNNTDEPLFRYIGSSAMKRRLFVERRTHIFCLNSDDSVVLQNPAIYRAVLLLSTYLLRHGGVTAIEDLYTYFTNQDDDPSIRDTLSRDRPAFLSLLSTHSFMFSVFPNRAYVAVKRALPSFDYPGFIAQYFPELARRYSSGSGGGLQKLMSIPTLQPFGAQGPQAPQVPQEYRNQYHHHQHAHHHHNHHQNNNGYGEQHYYDDGYQGYQEEYTGHTYHSNHHHHQAGNGYSTAYSTSAHARSSHSSQMGSPSDIWAPRPQQQHEPKASDFFSDETLMSREFGSLLSLSSAGALAAKTATNGAPQVQYKEENHQKIGHPNCTCKCMCGAQKTSAGHFDPFTPNGNLKTSTFGTIGQRPGAVSTNGSNHSDKKPSEPFNLFGVNDVLGGNFDALRMESSKNVWGL